MTNPRIRLVEPLGIAAAGLAFTIALLHFGARAVAPGLVVALAAFAFARPGAAFVVFALLAPFDAYVPSVRIYKDLLWPDVLMCVAIAGVISKRPWEGAPPLERAMALLALIGLAAVQSVSVLFASNRADSLDNLLRFLYVAGIIITIPAALTPRMVRAAAAALVVGTALRMCYEAAFYFTDPSFVLHPSYQFGVFTSNPNTLAGLAGPALVLAIGLGAPRAAVHRAWLLPALLIIVVGILLSFSKSAWVAAAAGSCVWLALVARRFKPRDLTIAALLILIAAAALPPVRRVPALMIDRWTSVGSALSNQLRLRYVQVALQIVASNPLLGVGLEQFPAAYRAQTRDVAGPDDPHNAYLHIAAELGLPALGLFVVFLTALWCGALRASQTGTQPWAAALPGAVAALAVFQLFSAEPWSSRVFWVVAALPWPLLPTRAAVIRR